VANTNPGCLDSILGLFRPKPKSSDVVTIDLPSDEEEETFPYRLRDDFLSPAEHSFYLVLKNMLGEHLTICPKVSLADIFFVVRPNENMRAYNKINRKHVDFLICDPQKMAALFGIELDDSSHKRPDRVDRDEFVEHAFDAAGLPLLRIPVRANYNTSELGALFRQALELRRKVNNPVSGASQEPVIKATPPPSAAGNPPPTCPKCGIPLTMRKATRGPNAGQRFWGCTNYPRCREVIPIDA
jgi:Protein of unknown function (DUF2726)/Topoisomerase DNA binding C4 zinc finger